MEEHELDIATIGKRSVHGVIALISRTFFLNIVSFVASIIIFTILTPADVGIYTAVIAMQRVINFFTDFGLGAALVQKKGELTQEDLVTSFTIQSILTFIVFCLVVALKPFMVGYFHLTESAFILLCVLVFSIFLSSFKTIPSILLERRIEFQKLVWPQIVEAVTFNVILIFLVLKGFGIYSFSWAFFASSMVSIPIYYRICPWKIGLGIHKSSLSSLRYGIQFQFKNILATVKDDFLTVFLTRMLPFTEIGYIGFAQRNAFFVFRYVVDSVTKVTFSTYSRIQHDKNHLKIAIEKSLFFVSLAMFPLMAGIILTAPSIIEFFPKWHNKWEPALISLIFFSLNALVSSMSNILVNVLDATGRVKTTLKLMIMWTGLTWTLTPLGIYFFGFNGVGVASFLITLTIFITVNIVQGIVPFSFIGSIYKPFVSTIVMSAVLYLGVRGLVYDFSTLIIISALGGVTYISCMYFLAKEEMVTDVKKILFNK